MKSNSFCFFTSFCVYDKTYPISIQTVKHLHKKHKFIIKTIDSVFFFLLKRILKRARSVWKMSKTKKMFYVIMNHRTKLFLYQKYLYRTCTYNIVIYDNSLRENNWELLPVFLIIYAHRYLDVTFLWRQWWVPLQQYYRYVNIIVVPKSCKQRKNKKGLQQ